MVQEVEGEKVRGQGQTGSTVSLHPSLLPGGEGMSSQAHSRWQHFLPDPPHPLSSGHKESW